MRPSEVTAVVLNYNGMNCLPRTLEALFACGFAFERIVLADDGSTDGSREWVREHYPQITIVGPLRNSANPNAVRNEGLRSVTTPYAFLMDHDVLVQPGCIEMLLEAMMSRPNTFCLTPRLLDTEEDGRVYADGGALHFLAVSRKLGRKQRRALVAGDPFPTTGSGIMLIDVAKGREIGFFDEGYAFGWADDGEFQLRGRLLGYEALHVPRATCLHRVKAHGTRRAYAQMRNRYRLILTYYSWRTLLLTGPSLLLFEGSLMVLSALKGFFPDWRASVRDTWNSRRDLLAVRRNLQRRRRRRDSELMEGGALELPGAVRLHGAMNALLRLAETVFDFNWRVARRFV